MPTQTELPGISLEAVDDQISSLTIDLENVITADALAKLLKSLADFYSVGVSLDNPQFDPLIEVETGWEPSSQLLISELIIGTPNRLKVSGRKKVMASLAAMLGSLATISGNVVELKKMQEPVAVSKPIDRPVPPSLPPAHPTLVELMDAIGKDNALLSQLDADYYAGKIALSDYVIRRNILEGALRDAKQAFHILCASSQSGPSSS